MGSLWSSIVGSKIHSICNAEIVSMMGVVTCTEDLEYIDTSLRGQVWLRRRQTSNADKIEVGSNGNRVRDDSVLETQKFSSISAANLGQTTAALYLNRNLITPDSTVP